MGLVGEEVHVVVDHVCGRADDVAGHSRRDQEVPQDEFIFIHRLSSLFDASDGSDEADGDGRTGVRRRRTETHEHESDEDEIQDGLFHVFSPKKATGQSGKLRKNKITEYPPKVKCRIFLYFSRAQGVSRLEV